MTDFIIGIFTGLAFGGGLGYKFGKSQMIRLLRIHQGCGRTLKAALDYEEAVMEGRVPSDAGSEGK